MKKSYSETNLSRLNDTNFLSDDPPPPYTSLVFELRKSLSDSDLKSIKVRETFKTNRSKKNFFESVLGCFRPLVGYWSIKSKKWNIYNIPFNELQNFEYLGAGAQGCVFKCLLNKQEVAVKKVKSKEEADIRSLRKLNHDNLVKFKGVSETKDFFCIIMEYCPYGQLYTHLQSRDLLQPSVMIDMASQIASGMNYLHMNRFIHRDLKSPNILIGENNVLKIGDFGYCKKFINLSTVMSFKGTTQWMAPELIRNEAYSEKVDVYSFGVVLWELLTCETPYKNLDYTSIIFGVGKNKLRLPIPNSAPDGIKILLHQCFMKPKNRPAFSNIIKHLEIFAKRDEIIQLDRDFAENKINWKQEVIQNNYMRSFIFERANFTQNNKELERRRKEEQEHLNNVLVFYEKKIKDLNNFFIDLPSIVLQLDEREQIIEQKEKELRINGNKNLLKEFQSKTNFETSAESRLDMRLKSESDDFDSQTDEDYEQKRKENEEYFAKLRGFYVQKIQDLNNMTLELSSIVLQLEERELEIERKEKELNVNDKNEIIEI